MKNKGAFAGSLFLLALILAGLKTSQNIELSSPAEKAGVESSQLQTEDSSRELEPEPVELRVEITEEDLQEIQAQKEELWEDYYSLTSVYTGIYKEPSYDSESVAFVSEQTKVLVTGREEGWYRILSGTVSGYIEEHALFSQEEAWDYIEANGFDTYVELPEAISNREKQKEAEQSVNELIAQARQDEKEREEKKKQEELEQLAYEERLDRMFESGHIDDRPVPYEREQAEDDRQEDDDWESTPDEQNDIQPADSFDGNSDGIKVVSYALQFVGNPYVYGGTSLTDGCDCSGFVQSVYKEFSIELPRTSREQATVGKRIDFYELQPGDLLFYINDGSVIGHVAMYIGGGKIVQAYDEDHGIVISDWNYRTPCLAKRVI